MRSGRAVVGLVLLAWSCRVVDKRPGRPQASSPTTPESSEPSLDAPAQMFRARGIDAPWASSATIASSALDLSAIERALMPASKLTPAQRKRFKMSETASTAQRKPAPPRDDRAEFATIRGLLKSAPRMWTARRAPPLGQILVLHEDRLEAIKPRAVRVVTHIQGPRARTVVDFVFENPLPSQHEGAFLYPLPEDAAPAGFSVFTGGTRVSDEKFFESRRMLPDLGAPKSGVGAPIALSEIATRRGHKQPARGVDWRRRQDAPVVPAGAVTTKYSAGASAAQDPLLKLWADRNAFVGRVPALEAGALKRVVLVYEQRLRFDGTQFNFQYKLPKSSEIKERDAVVFVDARHGRVRAPLPHAHRARAGHWLRFVLRDAPAGHAIKVAVIPKNKTQAVLRGPDPQQPDQDLFYAELRPQLWAGAGRATKRAVILVDTSLSSSAPGVWNRKAELLMAMLTKDESIERYAVMLFDVRARWLQRIGWIENTAENRSSTMRELSRVYLEGSTNLGAALRELDQQASWLLQEEPPTLFLLSEGEVTWGLESSRALMQRRPQLRSLRWIVYRFGAHRGRHLEFFARENEGRVVPVLSTEDVSAAAIAHRARALPYGSAKVVGAKALDIVTEGDPKTVFAGQVLRIAGRLPSAAKRARLRVRVGEKDFEVPLHRTQKDRFAALAWARLYTQRLLARDEPEHEPTILTLSAHYRLNNRLAAFDFQAPRAISKSPAVERSALPVLTELSELSELSSTRSSTLWEQPLIEAPFQGGSARLEEELSYREARKGSELGYSDFAKIARARASAGDTAGCVRALSSVVELRPGDPQAQRLVGYALLGLGHYEAATELFERLRSQRSFEAQAYLEEALALEAAGRHRSAARNYELVLAGRWRRHDEQVKTTARYHYARLLRRRLRDAEQSRALKARLASLAVQGVQAFQMTTHWSTDGQDLDLWVVEPSGEKCSPQNPKTAAGGNLYWDIRDGLGPELYRTSAAVEGGYGALVRAYGQGRGAAPTGVLMVVDRERGTSGSRRFLMRTLPEHDGALMLSTEVVDR